MWYISPMSEHDKNDHAIPLAERMRPQKFDDFVGQEEIAGKDRTLRRAMENAFVPSMILWGPPGSGKTTLANIIAGETGSRVESISAVLAGVKDVREIMARARNFKKEGVETILFVDEVHRFNRAQQDAFLHHIEDGTITFIGATTENPSFEVVPPLLSRCKVILLNPLTEDNLIEILKRAISDRKRGLGNLAVKAGDEILSFIAASSHGDARIALGYLEEAVSSGRPDSNGERVIEMANIEEVARKKALMYDKNGEEHYNVISAFIKSMRGSDPDAALYWLARMLEAGEDPMFIARRMVIFASEDIGNADPRALSLAIAARDSFHFIGLPEGWIPLAQAVTYLATAPKSNSSYAAYKKVKKDVLSLGALPVPLHIRNAPTKLMKEVGYGRGYKYPHDFDGGHVHQDYLPERLRGKRYYIPSERGYEKMIRERMEFVRRERKG